MTKYLYFHWTPIRYRTQGLGIAAPNNLIFVKRVSDDDRDRAGYAVNATRLAQPEMQAYLL